MYVFCAATARSETATPALFDPFGAPGAQPVATRPETTRPRALQRIGPFLLMTFSFSRASSSVLRRRAGVAAPLLRFGLLALVLREGLPQLLDRHRLLLRGKDDLA